MPTIMIKGRAWKFETEGSILRVMSPKKKNITLDRSEFVTHNGRLNLDQVRYYLSRNHA